MDKEKMSILQKFMAAATAGGAGRGLNDIMNNIKNALSTFKNFAKEWDGVKGLTQDGGQQGPPQPPKQTTMPAPKTNLQPPTGTPPVSGGPAGPKLPTSMPTQPTPPKNRWSGFNWGRGVGP